MRVSEIHFNHSPGNPDSDALSIRQNGKPGTEITAPEWTSDRRLPVAFSAAPAKSNVSIRASLTAGPAGETLEVRARGGGVFGDLHRRSVPFDRTGNATLVPFDLSAARIGSSGVSKTESRLTWQYRDGSGWTDFEQTRHTVFVTLGRPTWPWNSLAVSGRRLPWVDALDLACAWCMGLRSFAAISERVTLRVNQQSHVRYDGGPKFGTAEFMLHSYLAALELPDRPFVMNCTDAANAVVTLSNLLGCNLGTGRILDVETRHIVPIGGDASGTPMWKTKGWDFHEVAWVGAIGPQERLYDATLQLDLDDDDSDELHLAGHALNLRYGQQHTPEVGDYRLLLKRPNFGRFQLDGSLHRNPLAEDARS